MIWLLMMLAAAGSVRLQPDQGGVRLQPDQGSVRLQPDQGSVRLQPDQGGVRLQPDQSSVRLQPDQFIRHYHSIGPAKAGRYRASGPAKAGRYGASGPAEAGHYRVDERLQPVLRFHHLHYTVADPAAAMNRVALALEGTRVLLQGLGVGVRVGDQYVLFDRGEASPGVHAARTPAEAFRSAAAWLGARGVRAPASFTGDRLASVMRDEPLHHVAFAADSLEAARASLAAAGAQPTRESANAIMYRTPDGLHIELLRPTDVEDAFWCPMHPDVRSGHAGACPLCGMALVPIPPPRIGEYRMDVTVMPAVDGNGMSGLRLVVRDPETGAPVPSFARVHDRLLHLFIISRTLDDFAHVHPEAIGEGTFALKYHAAPGEYMLVADFLPHGGVSQIVQRAIVTPGYSGPLMTPVPDPPAGPAERVVDGVRIALDTGELAPRKPASLRFTVTEALTGDPVTDLEPFLGAPAHMLVVRTDLTEAIHGHPDEDDTGSIITFDPLMPTSGTYKLWVQFQRRGKVLTAPFVIEVPDR